MQISTLLMKGEIVH